MVSDNCQLSNPGARQGQAFRVLRAFHPCPFRHQLCCACRVPRSAAQTRGSAGAHDVPRKVINIWRIKRPASAVYACELEVSASLPAVKRLSEMCASKARPRPVMFFRTSPKRASFLAGPRSKILRHPLRPGTGPTSLSRLTVYPWWNERQCRRGFWGGDAAG